MAVKIGEAPGRPFRIPANEMSAVQANLVDRILAGPRKDLPVNMEIWLHSPTFAEVANRFAEYVGHLAPMTRRVKEITILVVAAYWQSSFEWFWHERLARQLEIGVEQVEAIRTRRHAHFVDPIEQAAHDLSVALLADRQVDATLHDRAVAVLGRAGVADLIGLIGLYGMVAHSLAFYSVPVPSPEA
jgi:4-carboxymuconolactone decarboxylase